MGSTWSRLRAEQSKEDDLLLSSQHFTATFVLMPSAQMPEHAVRAAYPVCRSHSTAAVRRLLFCFGQFSQGCSGPHSALGTFVDMQFETLEPHPAHGWIPLVLLPLSLGIWESMCLHV